MGILSRMMRRAPNGIPILGKGKGLPPPPDAFPDRLKIFQETFQELCDYLEIHPQIDVPPLPIRLVTLIDRRQIEAARAQQAEQAEKAKQAQQAQQDLQRAIGG